MTRAYAHLLALLTVTFVRIEDRFEDRKDRGATAVEYGLLVGLIAVAIITAVGLLGDKLEALFTGIKNALPGA